MSEPAAPPISAPQPAPPQPPQPQPVQRVARLLGLTLARCWWLLLGAWLLTWAMLWVPQGREFLEPALPLAQVLSLIVSAALMGLLLAAIAVWLVAPHDGNDAAAPPAAAWFAPGLVPLLAAGLVAWAQQAAAADALSPRLVLLPAALTAWFCAHFGLWRDVPAPGARCTALLWGCWLVLFGSLLLPHAAAGAVLATVALLAAHCVIAQAAPAAYQPAVGAHVPAPGTPGQHLRPRLILAPVACGVVVLTGRNNAIDPAASIGNAFGPVATLTLALAFWIAAAFLLVWAAALLAWLLQRLAHGRLPKLRWQWVGAAAGAVAALALVQALASGQMAAAPVRQLAPAAVPGAAPPTTEAWIHERLRRLQQGAPNAQAPLPLVIVAAEGGGIRAAYWTASVLAALHERYAGFAPAVTALSGISGGSVGVTVYQALQASAAATAAAASAASAAPGAPARLRQGVQQVLGDDFLSPALMALLVGEPLRDAGLAPQALDRAAALERGLEDRFDAVAGGPALRSPLCALQQQGGPLLLPGLTDARSGKRIVLACQPRSSASADITEPVWLDAAPALRASTAALLSARFPVLSPSGLLAHEGRAYRVVDGGFSDNSGAGTAVDVLLMVHAAARELGLQQRIRPVVLVISNAAPAAVPDTPAAPGAWAGGVLGLLADPLATLDAVRARNAADYRRWLDSVARQGDSRATVIEWRLPPRADSGYPLGWLLARATREAMATEVENSLAGPAALALEAATGWTPR